MSGSLHFNLIFAAVLLLCAGNLALGRDISGLAELAKPTNGVEGLEPGHKHAYVSLLYNNDFVLGLRVLGQSLRETGTERDLVAIVAGDVSPSNLATLRSDGWRLHRAQAIHNPGQWTQNAQNHGAKYPQRFWGVYTKLLIFNLTQYERLVFLDADVIAARNMDELFSCDGALCAVLRASERFNSGVMVLQPDADTFQDMMQRIRTTPSYTGGDQGFLNQYFSELPAGPLFDPTAGKSLSATVSGWVDSAGRLLARLPTVYNADLGLYIINSNRWNLPPDKIGVVHFTFGPFKPWLWWSSWIATENMQHWQALRARLPQAAGGGDAPGESSGVSLMLRLLAPWVLVLVAVRAQCCRQAVDACRGACGKGSLRTAERPAMTLPLGFSALAGAAGMASIFVGVFVAAKWAVPSQTQSRLGWALFNEWALMVATAAFGQYLRLCYGWGQRRAAAISPRYLFLGAKRDDDLRKPWCETFIGAGVVMAAVALLPWWTDILGVSAFSGKIIWSAVASGLSAVVCMQCFVVLAGAWFMCGAQEGNSSAQTDKNLE